MLKDNDKCMYKEFDTDHWIQLEQPDAFNKSLMEWLEKK